MPDAPSHAEQDLRTQTRAALHRAGISQAEAARQLDVSTKHMCQMLTGRAPLTLAWAERILDLCDARLAVTVLTGRRLPAPADRVDGQPAAPERVARAYVDAGHPEVARLLRHTADGTMHDMHDDEEPEPS